MDTPALTCPWNPLRCLSAVPWPSADRPPVSFPPPENCHCTGPSAGRRGLPRRRRRRLPVQVRGLPNVKIFTYSRDTGVWDGAMWMEPCLGYLQVVPARLGPRGHSGTPLPSCPPPPRLARLAAYPRRRARATARALPRQLQTLRNAFGEISSGHCERTLRLLSGLADKVKLWPMKISNEQKTSSVKTPQGCIDYPQSAGRHCKPFRHSARPLERERCVTGLRCLRRRYAVRSRTSRTSRRAVRMARARRARAG